MGAIRKFIAGTNHVWHMPVGIHVDPEKAELGRVETTHFTRRRGVEKLHVIGADNARRRQHELVHAVQVIVEKIVNVTGVVTFNLDTAPVVQ